jgi:hypothetical protein
MIGKRIEMLDHVRRRGSSVGIATGYEQDNRGYCQEFSVLYIVQDGSGAYQASYPMGTESKAAGPWSWPIINECGIQEHLNLYIHSPIRLHGVVFN